MAQNRLKEIDLGQTSLAPPKKGLSRLSHLGVLGG
jgi:hypothetical protein